MNFRSLYRVERRENNGIWLFYVVDTRTNLPVSDGYAEEGDATLKMESLIEQAMQLSTRLQRRRAEKPSQDDGLIPGDTPITKSKLDD